MGVLLGHLGAVEPLLGQETAHDVCGDPRHVVAVVAMELVSRLGSGGFYEPAWLVMMMALAGFPLRSSLPALDKACVMRSGPNGADINLQQLVGIVHVSLTADAHGLDRAAEVRRAIDQNVRPLREIIDELLHRLCLAHINANDDGDLAWLASDTASSASAEPRPAWIA